MEQRDCPRFEVTVPCSIEGAITGPFSGVIENISRNGLFLRLNGNSRSRVLPVVGETLSVDICLPANELYGQKYLHCSGTVVRVSNDRRSLPRVAISVDQMQFGPAFRRLSVIRGGKKAGRLAVDKDKAS